MIKLQGVHVPQLLKFKSRDPVLTTRDDTTMRSPPSEMKTQHNQKQINFFKNYMEKLTKPCIFPGGASDKEPPANAGDVREACSIPSSGRSLKKEMATHSSILAWKVPWPEEPGRLQSMGLQRVGHD